MPFKPNYGRDRAERQRAARSRTEEKQRKKEEKATLRKAQREAAVDPSPDEPTVPSERHPMPSSAEPRMNASLVRRGTH
jgi:hypothetical protein